MEPEKPIDFTEQYELVAAEFQQLAKHAEKLGIPFLMAFQAKSPQVWAYLPWGSDADLLDAAHALGVNKYERLARFEEQQKEIEP